MNGFSNGIYEEVDHFTTEILMMEPEYQHFVHILHISFTHLVMSTGHMSMMLHILTVRQFCCTQIIVP